MKTVFSVRRLQVYFLSLVLMVILAGPPAVAFLIDEDIPILAVSVVLVYLAFSPLILILTRLLLRLINSRIELDGGAVSSVTPTGTVTIPWNQVSVLWYDYLLSGRYYALYEVKGVNGSFRFYRRLSEKKISEIDDVYRVNAFMKKSYSLDSYGQYLTGKQTALLITYIRDYSGKEPQRKKNLLEETLTHHEID